MDLGDLLCEIVDHTAGIVKAHNQGNTRLIIARLKTLRDCLIKAVPLEKPGPKPDPERPAVRGD